MTTMMQQRERLYELDKPGLARDAAPPASTQPAVLQPGWICLERCNVSPVPGQVLEVAHVLLHAEIGVALIDIAPTQTQGAEAAFRARLEAARFAAIFPGNLPVVHLQIPAEAFDRLGTVLQEAFAALPPINLPGGDGWVSVVRRALAPRSAGRAAAPMPASAYSDRPAPPPMLNREVAAHRVGLPPQTSGTEAALLPAPRAGMPSIPVALGLAGLVALAATAAALWAGPWTADPPIPVAAAPERAGSPQAEPDPIIGGGPAATPRAPTAPAPAISQVPPPRVPDAAPTPVTAPPARERGASTLRVQETAQTPVSPSRENAMPLPPPAPVAAPPAPAPAANGPRVVVRSAANLRTGPDSKATVLRVVPRGEELQEFSRAIGGWVEVGDTRPQGWIHSKLLTPAKP